MASRRSPQSAHRRESPQPETNDAAAGHRSRIMCEQLKSGTYECMICTEAIRTQVATWHCKECFQVFHLYCLKKWSKSEGSGEGSSFRCPNCQVTYPTCPNKYLCFCGKRVDPQPDGFLVPHTCGEVCSRARSNGCPHPCAALCHPGPCADCTATAAPVACPCGKSQYTYPCGRPDPRTTCSLICGKPLACGNHVCTAPCHHGPCSPCSVATEVKCNCEKESRQLPCGSPSYRCADPCGRLQRCGVHKCNVVCHTGDSCPPCDNDPQVVFTCPCGKQMLPNGCRTKCEDPIPLCGSVCGRVLECGRHYCTRLCHEGACGECTQRVNATCSCGATQRKMPCAESDDFRCDRKCKGKLNCGKHECSVVCCPKRRSANPADHPCTRPCGKQLQCGHKCTDVCHRGNCQPCINIVTTELSCACGSVVLEPPLPCGTLPPECSRPCNTPLACGHAQVAHNCHFNDCPPCCERVERTCHGGHTTFKNVLCSGATMSCTAACGKPLTCGHSCTQKCHAGACTETINGKVKKCDAPCNAPLPCGHLCQTKCHADKPCPKCTTETEIFCKCGVSPSKVGCVELTRRKAETPAGAAVMTDCSPECDARRRVNFFAVRAEEAGGGRFEALSHAYNSGGPQRCYYSFNLWEIAHETPDAVTDAERHIAQFVRSQEKMCVLPAMARNKRAIIHELAQYFCVKTEAVDREPNRTICLSRMPMTRMPIKLLTDVIRDAEQDPNVMVEKVLFHDAVKCMLVFEGRPEHISENIVFQILRFAAGKFVIVAPELFPDVFPNGRVPPRDQQHLGDETVAYLAVFGKGGDAAEAFSTVRRAGCSLLFHMYGEAPPPMNFEASQLCQPRYFYNQLTTSTLRGGDDRGAKPQLVPKPGSASWATVTRKETARQKELSRPATVETANKFATLRR